MTTQPRCLVQRCPNKTNCPLYLNRASGFVEQYRVKGCKKFIHINPTHKPMEPTR